MTPPHAECREDGLWWRGSTDTFHPMDIHTARRLLPNLTGSIAYLAPDLAHAIEEYDRVFIRPSQAA